MRGTGHGGPDTGPELAAPDGVPAGVGVRHTRGVHAAPRRRAYRVVVPLAAGVAVVLLAGAAVVGVRPSDPAPAPASTPLAEAPPSASPESTTPSATAPASTAVPTASPSVKPSPRGSTARSAPPVTAVTSKRKGVGVWTFDGVSQALASSKASWYYTWNVGHPGVTSPKDAEFVPMIWGAGSVTAGNLDQARKNGRYLLGFNEPDMGGQADMSVEQALELWPRLEATGLTLGSPAVAWGGDRPGEWLDRFMTGARQRGYRVDFIALHWYGGDFTTANAVNQLKSYLQAVHDRYRLPVWLTEFALIDFSNGVRFPTQQQQAAFLTAATRMLGGLPWLHRYAWFGLPATDKDPTGLFRSGTEATAVGRAFQAAR